MKKSLLFLLLCQTVFAVAQLPSIIKEDFIIRKSMSPLKFNKTYIDKNVTLTIEPGVVLEGNKLEVDGTLLLLGKAHDSITIRIGTLITTHKIGAKYCNFNHTGLSVTGFDDGSGVFKNCSFSNSALINTSPALTCENSVFKETGLENRNGLALLKENTFISTGLVISYFGSASILQNKFVNITSSSTISIADRGKTGEMTTIKNNHFEFDSLYRGHDSRNVILVNFSSVSFRTVLIEDNIIKNYYQAFSVYVDRPIESEPSKTGLAITNNQVEDCKTILGVNSNGGNKLNSFLVKNNRFSKFKMAFIGLDSPPKTDKKAYIPYRINKNKYDISLADILKRIDDFGNDYEKWVWFEVEY